MAAAVGIGRFIYTPILPPMTAELGLSQGDAGLIASANFVGYLVGAMAAAARRLPGEPRTWLIANLVISAVTTVMMAFADTLSAFLVLRFVGGVASAFVLVLSSALVLERLAAASRGSLSAVHFAGVGSGIAVSAVVAWAVGEAGLGWRWIWSMGGLLALVASAIVWWFVPPADPQLTTETPPSAGSARQSSRLGRLTLSYGLFGFGYIITATFIVAIVRASPATVEIEPLVWLAVGLAGAPSIVVWAAVAKRTGTLSAYAIACLVLAVGVAVSVLSTTPAAILVAAVLVGGTFMGITALGLIVARAMAGAAARRAVATLTAAFGFGQIVGPLVAGYGYDLTGSFVTPSLIAVVALVMSAGLAMTITDRPTSTA
ncbi:MAG: YbfB/YjiJ family MFS transporter [Pseudomonadota bacterium]